MYIFWILVICTSCLFESVLLFPNGAPKRACETATPNHGVTAQTRLSPYSIIAQNSGSNVVVTMRDVNKKTTFRGFLLQAFYGNGTLITEGHFAESDDAKQLECFGAKNSLTHRDRQDKDNLTALWIPPHGMDSTIFFKATIVETHDVFWVGVKSNAVDVATTGEPPKYTPELSTPSTAPSVNTGVYSGCGQTRGCFGLPGGCVEKKACELVLTYSKPENENGIRFQLVGSMGSQTSGWFAMALSRDDKMGDDSVTECVLFSGSVAIYDSWNYKRGSSNANRRLPKSSNMTSVLSTDYENGVVSCEWYRPLHTVSTGISFDIEHDRFYILLAQGPVDKSGDKIQHDRKPGVSREPINLMIAALVGAKPPTLIKLHGCLMTIAWIALVSTGILMARHYKEVWYKNVVCGTEVWFTVHRSAMVVSVVFVVIGFVIIFVEAEGWKEVPNPHPVLGCVATSLMILQPIIAFFRPPKTSPKRPIFRWAHGLVGNGAHLIACINMFFAVKLEKANLPDAFYWVITTFIVFYCLIHLLIHVHSWFMEQEREKENRSVKPNQFSPGDGYPAPEEDGPGRKSTDSGPLTSVSACLEKHLGSAFKKFILGLYLLVACGLTAALVCMICLS